MIVKEGYYIDIFIKNDANTYNKLFDAFLK